MFCTILDQYTNVTFSCLFFANTVTPIDMFICWGMSAFISKAARQSPMHYKLNVMTINSKYLKTNNGKLTVRKMYLP